MASQSILNIITATVAIGKMDSDSLEQLLYRLLEKAPTTVIKVMSETGISFGDRVGTTYKVVVLNCPPDKKIPLIKLFRECSGAGLAESKAWSEGVTTFDLPAGVFAKGLTKEQAEDKMRTLVSSAGAGSTIRIGIMKDSDAYSGIDLTWRHS